MDTCTPFEGNSDLYGLGIRLGVYLQWISAWISLLLDPNSAQSIYDTNSVFVFAIMVASLIAAQQGTAAIEMYIMLQFMLGSFVTTLSTLGVRLWVMSPDRLAKRGTSTATALKSFWGHIKARLGRVSIKPLTGISKEWWPNLLGGYNMNIALGLFMPLCSIFGFLGQCLEQFIYLFRIELGILSKLKPPGLSWSGVIWRMTTAAVVTGYNLAFWFDDSGGGAQQPPRQGCGPPYIFLLYKQQLTGSVIALCRAAAVIIAVVVFPPAILLLYLMLTFWWYTSIFLYRDLIYFFNPAGPHTLLSARNRINALLEKKAISFGNVTPFIAPGLIYDITFAALTDVLGFLATPKANAIRFSDVIKVCVSLGTGKVTRNGTENTLPTHGVEMMPGWKEARCVKPL